MKIKITEIEASANELRASNTVADGFLNVLRNAFGPFRAYEGESEDECEDECEDEGGEF